MRRYTIALLSLTLAAVLATFVVLWCAPASFAPIMPCVALYFAVVTGVEHYLVFQSAKKDPRTFIKNFLGLTVGTLLLHMVVMVAYMFTHTHDVRLSRLFLVTFCIGYVLYLVFETLALVLFVRRRQ